MYRCFVCRINGIVWNPGVSVIPAIAAVCEHAGLGLRDAKLLIDASLEGQPVAVTCPDARSAWALLEAHPDWLPTSCPSRPRTNWGRDQAQKSDCHMMAQVQ